MNTVIKRFKKSSPEYALALALRTEVLRKPLGLEFTCEELKKDETDTHFGLFEADTIIACLTLTVADTKRMKMRQVAVNNSFQGKGYGKLLSSAAEKFALEQGFEIMFCHARKSAVGFYQNMGYKILGEEFTEVNIPHFTMQKQLK